MSIMEPTYFDTVPQELSHLLISFLDKPLIFIETFNLKIKNRHWEQIFSYYHPSFHFKIKHLMTIDTILRSERYTKNWKDICLNAVEKLHPNLNEYKFEYLPETENLMYSTALYKRYPQFYSRLIKLPGLFNRRYLYESLEQFVEDNDISKNHDFIEYWKSGLLKRHILLDINELYNGFPEFILLFMLEDFPDITKDNYHFIQYRLYWADVEHIIDNFVLKKILPRLPGDLIDQIRNHNDDYEVSHKDLNELIDRMRKEGLLK